jgi:hypothetical protein
MVKHKEHMHRRLAALAAAMLVGATVVAYWPAVGGDFIFDDALHLRDNPVLKPGGLLASWRPGVQPNYWPLTFSIYWLGYQCWGLSPVGYHVLNLALHAACALLLWRVLALVLAKDGFRVRDPRPVFDPEAQNGRETRDPAVAAAWLGAAFFALHPVNAESAAWVSQLKTILSLFFALLCVLFYLGGEIRGGWWRYAMALAAFALSALAKGAALTLPGVLLALVWWRRGRITGRDIWRLVPYVLIGGAMAAVEVSMQHTALAGRAILPGGSFGRIGTAGNVIWFYLWKLIWPLDLSAVYPRWTVPPAPGYGLWCLPAATLVLVGFLAWWQHQRWGRALVVFLAAYVILLLPVLGFTTITYMDHSLVADHWQYVALAAGAALVAGGGVALGQAVAGRSSWRHPACLGSVMVAVVLGSLASQRARLFANNEELWRDVLTRNLNSSFAYYNMGFALRSNGHPREAVAYYERAEQLQPDAANVHLELGQALFETGRPRQAAAEYERLLSLEPDAARAAAGLAGALNDAAWLLATRSRGDGGDPRRAVILAEAACKAAPAADLPGDLDTLGAAYASDGRFGRAIEVAQRALELAQKDRQTELAGQIGAHLAAYRASQPWREGPPLRP